ncbi:MAG TPA: IPT/TIG domain-containing protein, partial [Candidatus Polarisedimenticolaceae bacterium]|nr:IPT/TIG domain-containing protein [Candidatus Polarisedimenticolaceae bacterium]
MTHRGVAFLLVTLVLTGRAVGQTTVPTIEEISPAVVSVDGTTRVTVTGTGFAEGAWVEIEPASLRWPAKFPFQPGLRGLVVHGDVAALLLTQPARLQTWDVTDLERPVQLASLALPADPGPCVWEGHSLLVGLSNGSLLTLDMRDATTPVLTGTTSGTGQIAALVLSGARLFVLRSGLGVDLLDVTDPANPALRSAIPDAGVRGALAVEGNRLYFTDAAGVQIWDVTEVASPSWLGVVPVGQVSRIAVRGNRLIETAI